MYFRGHKWSGHGWKNFGSLQAAVTLSICVSTPWVYVLFCLRLSRNASEPEWSMEGSPATIGCSLRWGVEILYMLCFVCYLVVRLGVWHVDEHYSSQYCIIKRRWATGQESYLFIQASSGLNCPGGVAISSGVTMCQSWLMCAIPQLLLRRPEIVPVNSRFFRCVGLIRETFAFTPSLTINLTNKI